MSADSTNSPLPQNEDAAVAAAAVADEYVMESASAIAAEAMTQAAAAAAESATNALDPGLTAHTVQQQVGEEISNTSTANNSHLIVPPPETGPTATRTSLKLLTLGLEGARQAAQAGMAIPERFDSTKAATAAAAPPPVASSIVSLGAATETAVSKANRTLVKFLQAHNAQEYSTTSTSKQESLVMVEFLRVLSTVQPAVYGPLYHKVLHALLLQLDWKEQVPPPLWDRVRLYLHDTTAAVVLAEPQLPRLFRASDWAAPSSSSIVKEEEPPTADSSNKGDQYAIVHVSPSDTTNSNSTPAVHLLSGASATAASAASTSATEVATAALTSFLQEEVDLPVTTTTQQQHLEWHTFQVARIRPEQQALFSEGVELALPPRILHEGSRLVSTDGSVTGLLSGNNNNKRKYSASFKPPKSAGATKARHALIPHDKRKYIDGEPLDLDVKFGRGGGTK